MNITQYCDAINRDLIVTYQHNGSWIAYLRDCEMKRGSTLDGAVGKGANPLSAVNAYLKIISGQVLVFNASGKEMREQLRVPENITGLRS